MLSVFFSERNGVQDEKHPYHFTFKVSSIDLTASLPFTFFPAGLFLDSQLFKNSFPQGVQSFKGHTIDGDDPETRRIVG